MQLKLIASGKVRELYDLEKGQLLLVATDRISAYDVIMKNEVPEKGRILTQMSKFWFDLLRKEIPDLEDHLIYQGVPEEFKSSLPPPVLLDMQERSMVVKRVKVLPLESIVRGYITGSAWSSYKKDGTVHGEKLPEGLQESQKLDRPIWTPSTKAEVGEKDENISQAQAAAIVGQEQADIIANLSLKIYEVAHKWAASKGIILADTKFEFGIDESVTPPRIILCDEVLTPDSSRFWDSSKYAVGQGQDSYDKQYLRDWLTETGQKGKNGVTMPEEVILKTREKYVEAYERLTGNKWSNGS